VQAAESFMIRSTLALVRSPPAGDQHEPENGGRGNLLIRVPEINEGDVLLGKRGVVVEEYHHFSVEEEERGDERRKD
jgi:hypothetical protein